ncbi:YveK family protein [Planococcus salinus]|uniref:Capsular biosynthesis protein n=1 Tax=Planococcus salinus TaxID=1848460 RepID=A0A3M8P754_9BACL|nr:Wzz/FepE/Etk N-terminal domain-containing protein [Planococcus salinus]RNF39508.1 capsular biosynthesis protein [Planococcus salinus]
MEQQISLREVFAILKKNVALISIITILAIALAGVLSFYVMSPVYQTSTQLLVNQEQADASQFTNQNIETDLQLINTYNDIIKSSVILEQVIEDQGLDVSVAELNEKITISTNDNSQVIDISVRDEDPVTAVEIANATATIFEEEIQVLMNVNNVSILSPAVLRDNPSPVAPNPFLNMAVAAAVGLMIGIGLAFLLAYLDTTVKNEQDIETLLGIPVIGMISPIAEKEKSKEAKSLALNRREV